MKSICLIAKGPSAVHANEFLDKDDDIAVINDAGILVDGQIKYAFAPHDFNYLKSTYSRILFTVSPRNKKYPNNPVWFDEPAPDWWDFSKHITYEEGECEGDYEALSSRILSGGICHHATTSGSIHWLCKVARYEKIRIIGVDGGSEYAPAVQLKSITCEDHKKASEAGMKWRLSNKDVETLSGWKEVTERVSHLCEKVYGTTFEWFYDGTATI
jgi:hypothetical protein